MTRERDSPLPSWGSAMSLSFLLRRVLQSIAALSLLMLVVFVLVRMTGSPVDLYLPIDASPEQRAELSVRLGLDRPVHIQFMSWAWDLLRLDFGQSLWQNRPALELVLSALPQTLILGAIVLSLATVSAIVAGSIAAVNVDNAFDKAIATLSLAGASTPDFWLALMGISLFAVTLHWLPTSGYGGWNYWVLPVSVLFLRPFGILVQIVRGAMIEALNAPLTRTARAKGARNMRVVFVHALRNALLPVVTVVGDLAAQFAGGVTVIETVFGWPGIGKLMIDAIFQRDFAVLQAGILVVAIVIAIINIVVDALYMAIDPRVRMDRRP